MQITEQGVLAGLAVLTIVGLVLIIVISFLNVAVGLQTLAIFVAIWSFFFGLIYAGLFAYNTAVGGAIASNETRGDSSVLGPTETLTPLSDDFLRSLDDQLKSQDPAGIVSPFKGDD
jgi:hypothetical protein